MAQGLVDALSDEFQPGQYVDEYRTGVERVIEEKAAGRTPVFEEAKPRAAVIDLAAAFEASLAEARAAKQRHPSGATTAKKTRATKSTAAAANGDEDAAEAKPRKTRARKSA